MKIAYFNCASGIAGDMILAACIDAGINARKLESQLHRSLKITDWRLKVSVNPHTHYPAKQVTVVGTRSFSSPGQMKSIIRRSTLPAPVKRHSMEIFDCLLNAEARVHGLAPHAVHFHELNSIDTLVDITGACLCFHLLNIDEVYASSINVCNPAPATIEIIKKTHVPVFSQNTSSELATPTGMAIISHKARCFGTLPPIKISASGIGSGTLVIPGCDNVLKLIIGDRPDSQQSSPTDTVVLLETNIDDMDPRIYPYVVELLMAAGARDAWLTQVLMKKGRPGIVLSVLCHEREEHEMLTILFTETTTLGIRRSMRERILLKRSQTKYTKIGFLPQGGQKISSEFETAQSRARKTGVALRKLLR
ncbi:MAG: LarC family nickel insertion protein [Endomicrobiales bacterium]|jgi:uncharacterized protein (TIGR00299 family) protein